MNPAALSRQAAQSIVDEYQDTGLVNTAEAIGWIPAPLIPSFDAQRRQLNTYYLEKEAQQYVVDDAMRLYVKQVETRIRGTVARLQGPKGTFGPKDQLGTKVTEYWPFEPQYNRLSDNAKAHLLPVLERSEARHYGPLLKDFLRDCRMVYLPISDADRLPLTFDQAVGRLAVEHLAYLSQSSRGSSKPALRGGIHQCNEMCRAHASTGLVAGQAACSQV